MSARPAVSVVIPTHNRVQLLLRSITAFERQDLEPGSMELVVVADGCSDSTVSVVEGRAPALPTKTVVLDGRGPGAARNAGADVAEAPILLFVDDDIEPPPGFVQAHLRAHERQPGRIVMGPSTPSEVGRSAFFRMQVRSWWHAQFLEMARPGHRFTYRDVLSGNLSIAAAQFRALGGFDPSLRVHEDFEFGTRAIEAGIQLHFETDAEAFHHEHETTTLDGILRRARDQGRSMVVIGRKHPPLRHDLFADLADSEDKHHRRLRWLLFKRPLLGSFLARLARASLPILELFRMRHRWRKVFGALFSYQYFSGVASELGSEAALSAYIERGPVSSEAMDTEPVLDLEKGLESAERALNESRPESVRLRYGTYELGRIEPEPLTEPLRGGHLRPILAEKFATQILHALAHGETALGTVDRTRDPTN